MHVAPAKAKHDSQTEWQSDPYVVVWFYSATKNYMKIVVDPMTPISILSGGSSLQQAFKNFGKHGCVPSAEVHVTPHAETNSEWDIPRTWQECI